jgi:hypothetical protein
MKRTFEIPHDPLMRFHAIYEALGAHRNPFGDAMPLHYSAVSLVTAAGEPADLARDVFAAAEALQKNSGWFNAMRSVLRFIVAATLLPNGRSAEDLQATVNVGSGVLREMGMRHGGASEAIALLILSLRDAEGIVDRTVLARFREMYEMMKSYHWWLTGPEDFPACALLAGLPGRVKEIGQRVEHYYTTLAKLGIAKGDALQLASHLLTPNPASPATVVARFLGLHEGFKAAGIAMRACDYDELSLLTYVDAPPARIVERVKAHRAFMEGLKPAPDRVSTFSLACGTTFVELAKLTSELRELADLHVLNQVQAILVARAAATAATAGA